MDAQRCACNAPHLTPAVAKQAPLELQTLWIVSSQFDKNLTRFWVVCHKLHERCSLRRSLLGNRFVVWGWAPSCAHAKAAATFQIIDEALKRGVVTHSLDARPDGEGVHAD